MQNDESRMQNCSCDACVAFCRDLNSGATQASPLQFIILHSSFCTYSLSSIRFTYPQSLPYVMQLLVTLAVLTLLVYPAQLKRIPRRIRWLVPGLRLLAFAAIVVSMLRPVMTRPRNADERAPVVIVLDDSASMSVVNANRTPAEWVGTMAAMGKLPADVRDTQLDALQAGCDRLSAQADEVGRARAELDYARLSGRDTDAAKARLAQAVQTLHTTAHETITAAGSINARELRQSLEYLARVPARMDPSAWLDHVRDRAGTAADRAEAARLELDNQLYRSNEKVREACRPLQSLSRLALSQYLLFDPDAGLLARLAPGTAASGFCISDRVTPIDLQAIRASHQSLPAEGSISNLTGGLRALLESMQSALPRAIVLFSDGRLNEADTDPSTLAALRAVPIFAVRVASRSEVKDLSVIRASVPSMASVGQTVTLTAELRAFGLKGLTTSVTVTGGGSDETREITFNDDRPEPVSFNRRFDSPGDQRLTLTIAAIPGELSYQNNSIERWVKVSAAGVKINANPRPATRPANEAEMVNLTGDEGWLRQLCDSSGGEFLRLDQVDLLPKRLDEIREDLNHPIEIPLWDGLYLYALVLGCLTTEWALRKHYGLV